MNLLFAGWGVCGPLNEPGVFEFFGLTIVFILAAYLIAGIFIGIGSLLLKLGIIGKIVGAIMIAAPTLYLVYLIQWGLVADVFNYVSGNADFCDPLNGTQSSIFVLLFLVGILLDYWVFRIATKFMKTQKIQSKKSKA